MLLLLAAKAAAADDADAADAAVVVAEPQRCCWCRCSCSWAAVLLSPLLLTLSLGCSLSLPLSLWDAMRMLLATKRQRVRWIRVASWKYALIVDYCAALKSSQCFMICASLRADALPLLAACKTLQIEPQIERQKGVFSLNLFALISVIYVCVCLRIRVCVGYRFSAAIAIRMLFWIWQQLQAPAQKVPS